MSDDARELMGQALASALQRAQRDGVIPAVPAPEIRIQRPPSAEHGDYASNVALRLASAVRMPPLDVATLVAARVERVGPIADVQAVLPGFINFRVDASWKRNQLQSVIDAGDSWGRSNLGRGQRVQVEFVSANPTGPLQVGNGRGAVLGDTLANVLGAAGYDVQREYYINNMGEQVQAFGRTLFARYRQAQGQDAELPDDAYQGQYMAELAGQVYEQDGSRWLHDWSGERPPAGFISRGLGLMIRAIRADLRELKIEFDHWQPESALYQAGANDGSKSSYETTMRLLREGGFVIEKDDAVWFHSTDDGAEKDSVLIRKTGEPTYFASDVAYHYNKFIERSFDLVINVWGSDHHGHVARTKAAVDAVGGDSERLEVLLYQLVHLRRDGERIRMSKRTGELVTLRELIEEVGSPDIPGSDVVRFFFLQSSADAQMDFDLNAVTSQDIRENPLAYINYAHTRCASILRAGRDQGLAPTHDHLDRLGGEREDALINVILRLPELVADAAMRREPHHLPAYALELARTFTRFYDVHRVVDVEDRQASEARLALVSAARCALASVLRLIGVTPARSMHHFRAADPPPLLENSGESRRSIS